jgi:hypothetical protein
MSLPIIAIDRLFERLSATYGAQWSRQWDGVPMQGVKTAWANELAGYERHLKAIAWALENLPERCPNLVEFRNLCRQAPATPVALLDAPKADPERVAAELARLAPVRTTQDKAPPKAWAKLILSRHAGGEKLTPAVLAMARAATHYEPFYDVHGQMRDSREVAALATSAAGA